MPKKQTQSKPSRTKQDSGEGLQSAALLADLVEQWERRCVALDKLADDAEKTACDKTIARLKTKAGVVRSMTVELKREIRNANAQALPQTERPRL